MTDGTYHSGGKEKPEPYINAYRFEVTTGLRPGEILGLQWKDIGENGMLRISRSINVYQEVTSGKNENANRLFQLKKIDLDILKKQQEQMLASGVRSDYIFSDPYGDPIKPNNYYKHWVRYRDGHGLEKASPYELRHTFVSVVKELPEGLLKQLVGHSVNMDTYRTYSHEMDGDMQRTAELTQQLFDSLLENKSTWMA